MPDIRPPFFQVGDHIHVTQGGYTCITDFRFHEESLSWEYQTQDNRWVKEKDIERVIYNTNFDPIYGVDDDGSRKPLRVY